VPDVAGVANLSRFHTSIFSVYLTGSINRSVLALSPFVVEERNAFFCFTWESVGDVALDVHQ